MNGVIREALTLKYKGDVAAANANIKVYLLNPAGICLLYTSPSPRD